MLQIIRKSIPINWNRLIPSMQYATVADDLVGRNVATHQYKREIRQFPSSQYGGYHIVTFVYSTGIGLKLFNVIRRIVQHVQAPIYWEPFPVPQHKIKDYYVEEIVQSIVRNRAAVKTNFDTMNRGFGHGSMSYTNNTINSALDLFAGVVRFKTMKGIKTKANDVDTILIYQNTLGDFSSLEYEPVKGVVESIKVTHRPTIDRLIEYACKYAIKKGRKRITIVNKETQEIHLSESMFRQSACCLQDKYPQLEFEGLHVRNMINKIFKNPSYFDVVVVADRFASPLASAYCGICGGKGLFMGSSYNDHLAVYEPAEIKLGLVDAKSRLSSPIATLSALVATLRFLGLHSYAKKIKAAVWKTTLEDNIRTYDLGGKSTTTQVCEQIMRNIDEAEMQELIETRRGEGRSDTENAGKEACFMKDQIILETDFNTKPLNDNEL